MTSRAAVREIGIEDRQAERRRAIGKPVVGDGAIPEWLFRTAKSSAACATLGLLTRV